MFMAFFFSSRRRHTRWPRDWSSDVCSSDLPALSLIADADTYLVLEDLKREGKIRFYGVSVHPPEEGLAAVEVTRPDTVQIVYNLVRREAEDRFFVEIGRASCRERV